VSVQRYLTPTECILVPHDHGNVVLSVNHLADREALLTLLQRAVECIEHLRHGVRDVPAEEAVLAACREKLAEEGV
jgi:hypothetical protein